MRITSEAAARLCNLSLSYTLRLAKALGFRLDRGHRSQRYFGTRHVVGLMVLPVLGRAGVSDEGAAAVAHVLGSLTSDELFEAHCAAGRSWVLALGAHVLPELVTLEQVRASAQKYAAEVSAAGLRFVAIDLAPLLTDVRTAAIAAEGSECDAQPAE